MITSLRRTLAANPTAVDAVIALALTLLSIIAVAGGAPDVGTTEPLSLAFLLLQTLPLVARRRWPLAVLIVTTSATIAHVWLSGPGGVSEGLGPLIALYTVAEQLDRRTSLIAAGAVALGFGGVIIVKGGLPVALQGLLTTEAVVVAAWALGDWGRTRRLYAAAVEERAARLDQDRDELARRAVQDERERIARELHDIVTHHVSVIVIQAGAALTAVDRRPDQAKTALQAIDATGREALADMRRMLGILGVPSAAPSGAGAPDGLATNDAATTSDAAREPMPDLARLGELLEQVRAAGLPVEIAIDGGQRPLDAGIELTAYRVVQEALTNVLKHATGARARVVLRYGPDALDVTVTDEGGSGRHALAGADRGGRGLVGMRERVAVFDGTLEAGPTPTGFRVAAHLPIGRLPDPDPAAVTA